MEHSHYALAANPTSEPSVYRSTPQALYTELGKTYEQAYSHDEGQIRSLQWLITHLPPNATVLDMGCGTGVAASKMLSEAGFRVTGIDISPVMLACAREAVPGARFVEGDILTSEPRSLLSSPPVADDQEENGECRETGVDAIVAYFSLIGHVSQQDTRDFFARAHQFLKPGGVFVFGTVPLEGDQVVIRWMGRDFPSSGFSTENTIKEIEKVGFEVLEYEEMMFLPKGRGGEDRWLRRSSCLFMRRKDNEI
ncbi:Putative S-adenosyl-L-methionine-dependent methyltransferase, Methyltransferase domain 25 [Septoria linicola]|uniref:S-adenosyl-L-methionine-dependent methyltransferase, Methyltransferase domain 25 n=1 Tax=Septoria linicola TaxID=215465 RepID=A0A9Q9EH95_9PEZI|nr:putative S-adenosyl-L-methionine-dependent methyltransferase, Methyltransferase domain 25 [Septoria linicola]USW50775.1 Putative S-adenosyl-L-methionine-dependent methyltransferase, Methyltransferase domain 25 [Septoria linicola]